MEFPFKIDKVIEGLAKITLKGGLVGKACMTVCIVAIVAGFIACIASNSYVALVSILLIVSLAAFILEKLIKFADKHPQAALLEGAEFLRHEKLVHASKQNPVIRIDGASKGVPEPIEGEIVDLEAAELPDEVSEYQAEKEK